MTENAKGWDVVAHDRPARYGAYLVRYWEVRSSLADQPSSWRFSLEEAGTEKRRGFPDLGALLAYLEREFGCENAGAASVWAKQGGDAR